MFRVGRDKQYLATLRGMTKSSRYINTIRHDLLNGTRVFFATCFLTSWLLGYYYKNMIRQHDK